MADYSVTARFEADAAGYISAVQEARRATDDLGDSADKAGNKTSKAFTGSGQGLKQTTSAADKAKSSVQGVGDAAGHTGKHAQSAFEGIADGVGAANISLDGAKGKYVDLGNTAQVAMSKAAQGIRNNASDMKAAGAATATVGASMAAVTGVVAKTGIEYNTLQQVAKASLETMTGSAQAAAAQMDKLNAFAAESPFGKDTWIRAQQQLMAFGLEAEQVIPSLEGIENAVAAIGGGDQEIMQIVDILGSVEGQGKITGRELQRLGQMGIDAASLIGESMGKSGDQIREEISAGAIDAETAIAALTDGMNTRFEGAGANLKNTFEGALDRVRAAFRDVSADMFNWAVGSDGGGLFVDLLNGVADFIRVVEDLPGPVKNAVGIIGTLASGATVAAGGFLLLAPRVMDSWDAFTRLAKATGATTLLENIQSKAPGAATALKNVGKFAGIATVALAGMKLVGEIFTQDQIHDIDQFDEAVRNLANTGVSSGIDRMFSDWATMKLPGVKNSTDDIVDMDSAMARLAEPKTNSEKFNQWADEAFAWTGAAQSDLTQIEQKVSDFGDSLAGMVNEGEIEAASNAFNTLADSFTENGGEVEDLVGLMPSYIESLQAAAESAGVTITESEALEWALTGVAPAAVEAAGGLDEVGAAGDNFTELGEKADSASASLEGTIEKIRTLGAEFRNQFIAEGDMYAAIDNFTDALAENGATLDANTEAGRANREALVSMFDASEEYAASILESGGSTEEAAGAMRTAYDTMVANAEAMGLTEGEAKKLAAELLNIPDGVNIDTFFDETAREMAMSLANEIEAIPDHKVIGIAAQEDGSFVSVQESVNSLGETVTVIVDAEGNVTEVTEEIRTIDGHQVKVYVDDDGTVYELEGDLEEIEQSRHSTTIEVEANPAEAERKISGVANKAWNAYITGQAETGAARGELDSTASPRDSSITATPFTDVARSQLNNTANPRNAPITGLPFTSNATAQLNTAANPRNASITGVPYTSIANNQLNRTADPRNSPFNAIPGADRASSWLNTTANPRNAPFNATQGADNVSGWLSRLARPITVTVSAVASGISNLFADGGVIPNSGGYGNYQDVLPRKATGGRLPYTGLGQDMILGRNRHGVPTAWVDDGEWVVREQMSRKFHHAIGLINADHPSIQYLAGLDGGGQAGRTRLASNMTSGTTAIDYTRLAEVMGDRRNVTYQANLSNANSTMHDAMDAFQRMDMAESRR